MTSSGEGVLNHTVQMTEDGAQWWSARLTRMKPEVRSSVMKKKKDYIQTYSVCNVLSCSLMMWLPPNSLLTNL